MKLIRSWSFPEYMKSFRKGPCTNGFYLALKNHNDLPYGMEKISEHDLEYLLENGDVWFHNAERNTSWQQLTKIDSLPVFTSVQESDYEGCYDYVIYSPYLVEFYFVPTTRSGRRHMVRSSKTNRNLCQIYGWE